MKNDGVTATTKIYGRKGRRIRALARNEHTLRVIEANLNEVSRKMDKMERNPELYVARDTY